MHEICVRFYVPGEPAPQGSKKHVGNGVMIESNKRTRPWRALVADCASTHKAEHPDLGLPMCGPITASIKFTFARPASVKRVHHITKPDVDKLARAILDSLKGVLIVDDSMINALAVTKEYGEPGVQIQLVGSPFGTPPERISKCRSGPSARDAG